MSLHNDILGQDVKSKKQVNDVFLRVKKEDIFIHLFIQLEWHHCTKFAKGIWTLSQRIHDTILPSLIMSVHQNVFELVVSRQVLRAGMEKDIGRKLCRHETKSIGFITLVCVIDLKPRILSNLGAREKHWAVDVSKESLLSLVL